MGCSNGMIMNYICRVGCPSLFCNFYTKKKNIFLQKRLVILLVLFMNFTNDCCCKLSVGLVFYICTVL